MIYGMIILYSISRIYAVYIFKYKRAGCTLQYTVHHKYTFNRLYPVFI